MRNIIDNKEFNHLVSFPNRVSYKLRRRTGWGLLDWRVKFVYKVCSLVDKIRFWKKKRICLFEISANPTVPLSEVKGRRFKTVTE